MSQPASVGVGGRVTRRFTRRVNGRVTCRGAAAALVLALITPACGGPVMSGVAVGKVGHHVSAHAYTVPQGAEVCALQEALGAATEKPTSETCGKALKNDLLWRRSMVVLGAYGETLEAVASGTSADTAGQLEAALTGVRGADWIEVEGTQEQAARDAAAQLVTQIGSTSSKGDLGRVIKDAAPHVKTLCDGLGAYLEAQTRSLGDIQKDVEKKRASRTDRRCASLDGKTVCVGESVIDRMLYANVFGQAAVMESNHGEARDAVAAFCAAHVKLEEAAAAGRLSKDRTYSDVVEAVKSLPRTTPAGKPAAGGKPPKK